MSTSTDSAHCFVTSLPSAVRSSTSCTLSHILVFEPCSGLLGNRFVWHSLHRDVSAWCKSCLQCQLNKGSWHHHSPLQHTDIPDRLFAHIHVDFVGPFPEFSGFSFLFNIADRCTQWPEAVPLTCSSTSTCADAHLLHWVSQSGFP